MQNHLILFLLLIFSKINAQETSVKIQCIYRLDFQPDSTDPSSKKTEDMLLLIKSGRSLFLSKNQYLSDSSFRSGSDLNINLNYSRSIPTAFKYLIIKDTSNKITYQDYIDIVQYEYKEIRNNTNWVISEDTATINGFKCQKATTEYGGRKWISWFSLNVLINDGPYKFNGLPGLIIQVKDSQGYYNFTLTELINNSRRKYESENNIQQIEKKEYYKSLEYFKKNQFEMAQARGVNFTSGAETIRARMEDRNRRNNNPIELITYER